MPTYEDEEHLTKKKRQYCTKMWEIACRKTVQELRGGIGFDVQEDSSFRDEVRGSGWLYIEVKLLLIIHHILLDAF